MKARYKMQTDMQGSDKKKCVFFTLETCQHSILLLIHPVFYMKRETPSQETQES